MQPTVLSTAVAAVVGGGFIAFGKPALAAGLGLMLRLVREVIRRRLDMAKVDAGQRRREHESDKPVWFHADPSNATVSGFCQRLPGVAT